MKNLIEKFPKDIVLLKEVKDILKSCPHIDPDSTLKLVKEAYTKLKDENPKALIELYSRQEKNLPLLVKGLKRVQMSAEGEAREHLRQYLIKTATALLEKSEIDQPAIFEALLNLCERDNEKLQHIFTHCKRSELTDLRSLYLDEMSPEAKSSLPWIVTNIKLTQPTLTRNDLGELESKSNALSSTQLSKLVSPSDSTDKEFLAKVFVYAKYSVLKQMASEGKHDIAAEYCKKVIFDHKRNWHIQRMILEKLAKSGVKLSNVLTVIREAALDQLSAKTFEHLKNLALVESDQVEATRLVYEAKVHTGSYANDEDTYIEYYCYLKGNDQHLAAKRVLERALERVTDKQKVIASCL